MDDLKAKWKKAFSFGAKPKGFKGAGHKLGTGEIKVCTFAQNQKL